MRKKGQALVEFIIILPIFLILMMGLFDLGRLFYLKIKLEDQISEVVDLYQANKTEEEIKEVLKLDNIEIDLEEDEEYINLALIKEVNIITPGLNLFLKNPYKLEVARSILNEA